MLTGRAQPCEAVTVEEQVGDFVAVAMSALHEHCARTERVQRARGVLDFAFGRDFAADQRRGFGKVRRQ